MTITTAPEIEMEQPTPVDHFRSSKKWYSLDKEQINGLKFSLAIFTISRLLIVATAYAGTKLVPGKNMKGILLSWDSGWYYNAAQHGYPHVALAGSGNDAQNTIAFFPLFPLLARGLHNISTLSVLQAGIVVSLLFGAIAASLLWFLARRLTNVRSANAGVALFCFFPGSLAALLMMSDAVMIALAIGCILSLLQRRWFVAGMCAAFATADRPNALVLAFCCAWAACDAIWKRREWRSLIAPVLAPMGAVAYFTFLWHHTGDFFAWNHVEAEGWAYDTSKHFESVKAISHLVHPLDSIDATCAAIALLFAIGGLIALAFWRPPAVLTIYAVGICLLAFDAGGTASKLRYVWTAFPLTLAFGRWAQTELRFVFLLTTSAFPLAVYTLFALLTLLTIL